MANDEPCGKGRGKPVTDQRKRRSGGGKAGAPKLRGRLKYALVLFPKMKEK